MAWSCERILDIITFIFISIRLLLCPSRTSKQRLTSLELEQRKDKVHTIACPVLAILYNQGLLHPDEQGKVSWQQLYVALQEIGTLPGHALFHSAGIAAFKDGDFHQTLRSRCGKNRYINIFRLNLGAIDRHEFVKHGFSTTIRDVRFDPTINETSNNTHSDTIDRKNVAMKDSGNGSGSATDSDSDDAADTEIKTKQKNTDDANNTKQTIHKRRRESRRQRFERWFTRRVFFLREDRCYLSGLARVLKEARDCGEKSGEWSQNNMKIFHPNPKCHDYSNELIEYQATIKWASLFVCFGQVDEGSGRLYMSREALESVLLDSKFPAGYIKKKAWGFESTLRSISKMSEFNLSFSKLIEAEFTDSDTSTAVTMVGNGRSCNGCETQLSDLKVTWRFIKLMQSKGIAFLNEINSEDLAGSNGTAVLYFGRASKEFEKNQNQRKQDFEEDIENGFIIHELDDVSSADEGGRLSLESLESIDDDTAPLILDRVKINRRQESKSSANRVDVT